LAAMNRWRSSLGHGGWQGGMGATLATGGNGGMCKQCQR
jgi:hypothetical protein